MFKNIEAYRARIALLNIALKERIWGDSIPLKMSVYAAPDRVPFAQAKKGTYKPAKEGEVYEPLWATFWFRVEATIPPAWKGREVHLFFSNQAESLVFTEDGTPIQGLTSADWAPKDIRSNLRVTERAKGGERVVYYIESACNPLGGAGLHPDKRLNKFTLAKAQLLCLNREANELSLRCDAMTMLAEQLPEDHPLRKKAIFAGQEIAKVCDPADPATYAAAIAAANAFFEENRASSRFTLSAIGHAHIDTAWLWPLAETKRKCARTFSSAVRMMARYPEYKFACSQAQQLAWIKELHPALFSEIKKRTKKGQFCPVGGTWIEPDCNMPSGESFVRQFLLGQRFFEREFGERCRVFWNPDVFGYSAAMPQIMKQAGIDYFLTQKLSWNDTNKPASCTFLWEGIDGTRVLTHFPPSDTYNANIHAKEVLNSLIKHKDIERATDAYILYGHGDGGGGPTEDMVERIALFSELEGFPKIENRGPTEFFERCDAGTKDPVVWSGELYFEMHRGTYTSQAANKRDNRRSEELLHDVELLAAVAQSRNAGNYPHAELTRLWELVCLNQFHDIIPGSSIQEVYVDSAKDYADILGSAKNLRGDALKALGFGTNGKGRHVAAINTLWTPRREVVQLQDGPAFVETPAMGYRISPVVRETSDPVRVEQKRGKCILENSLVRAELDERGRLVRFYDKRNQREALAPGALGNQHVMFVDQPTFWEAWDIDIAHIDYRKEVGEPVAFKILSESPLECAVEVTLKLSATSTLKQVISLRAESPRLDFACDVDWQEDQKFLKVEFPLDLRSDYATYEMQFGHVRRPTHFNTSWDYARFEVCGHRWADLSEPTWGVALLNDSKYGYSCHGNVMRLSLLRAPRWPDPVCDKGKHSFRYALFPHAGAPQTSGVIAEAAAFNQPLLVTRTDALEAVESFFSIENHAIVIDTVKKAEDSDALIVRLYESTGSRQRGVLKTTLPYMRAERTNLLEDEGKAVKIDKGGIPVDLKPFELLTIKLLRK